MADSSHDPALNPIDVGVGARIKLRRKALGLSQAVLAEALGVTFQQVQKYERGRNRISAPMLVLAAKRLDCSVGYLVGEAVQDLPQDASLLAALASPHAMEALLAFNRIANIPARAAALQLLRALGSAAA